MLANFKIMIIYILLGYNPDHREWTGFLLRTPPGWQALPVALPMFAKEIIHVIRYETNHMGRPGNGGRRCI
jgi:hypothetical protein